MFSDWSKPGPKYKMIKESNLSFLMRPKLSPRVKRPINAATTTNLATSVIGKYHEAAKDLEPLLVKNNSLNHLPRGEAPSAVEEKPRIQFRLQSAKLGEAGRERHSQFFTKAIVIEDKSLSLLKTMYQNLHYVAPKYRGVSQAVKDSLKLDSASSFIKDNGERPLSTTYFINQNKSEDEDKESVEIKKSRPFFSGKSSLAPRSRPASKSMVQFAAQNQNVSLVQEHPLQQDSRPPSRSYSKDAARHKVLVFDRHETKAKTGLASMIKSLAPVSSKDLLQLKKKKKVRAGHAELVNSKKSLDITNAAMQSYLAEAASRMYYVDYMKKLLFEDNPTFRDMSEKVRAALYKTLTITRTLHGSFGVFEHLKKRKEMILLNPKQGLKKGKF